MAKKQEVAVNDYEAAAALLGILLFVSLLIHLFAWVVATPKMRSAYVQKEDSGYSVYLEVVDGRDVRIDVGISLREATNEVDNINAARYNYSPRQESSSTPSNCKPVGNGWVQCQ